MSNLPATLEQRVKDRINETIADLIPPDELARLVEMQVNHFRRDLLNEAIKNEVAKHFTEAIRLELGKPDYQPKWDQYGRQGASEAVQKIITDGAGSILAGLIGGAVHQTIYNLQSNLPRY